LQWEPTLVPVISLPELNLPAFEPQLLKKEDQVFIFDFLRKKHLVLTPEEWVRQHWIRFLIDHQNFPKGLVTSEKGLVYNGLQKRTDLLVFDRSGLPYFLIECKAPEVTISQNTFDQIAHYNMTLQSNYLMVTNGLNHYFCQMDFENEKYQFLSELPNYQSNLI
jgi:hypothetical protein